ncbi:MAG: hypothetical protein CVT67_02360 [Actinobacteria bacterium HGW-Actinobacteria-7]|nr:MAG: hypothetical protein CVT67_02360 [Actinobacteria bacterium HGW-Actinobacteria-7]
MTTALDMRTIFLSGAVLIALTAAVIVPLWTRNRVRSPEIGFWLVAYVMRLVGILLIGARGAIPDLLSIMLANALVLGSGLILYLGLERYLGKRGSQAHNYVVFAAFLGVHAYFTYVHPDLLVRNINSAVVITFIVLQAAWLTLFRVEPAQRPATRAVGVTFLAYAALYTVRVFGDLSGPTSSQLLQSGPFDATITLIDMTLWVALTFALFLMVNRRLFGELEQDIRERMAAENALKLSEAKFSNAFHTSPDAVNINRLSDGLYLDVNEGFTMLTGFTAEDVAARTSADIHIWNDSADRDRLVAGLRANGVVNNLEAVFRRKDGSLTTALMSARVIDVDGERCILSVTRDISDRKRAEDEIRHLNAELEQRVQERTEELTATNEELLDANNRLEEATRAKSVFLASMSHELRTPLNSIIGFSDILARGLAGELAPEQQKQTKMINTSGKHLLLLVNEVLDLSAIEAGQMRIEYAPVDTVGVVRTVAESLMPLADKKKLELSWQVHPEASSLVSDHTRLEQILFNLLGNAIKFTEVGSIRLEVRRAADDVVFALSDTGRGISAEHLVRIFDEFYQVERQDVAKSDGTGLGLTVSKRLVEMLGGTIEAQSELGVGSTFTVRLPVAGL